MSKLVGREGKKIREQGSSCPRGCCSCSCRESAERSEGRKRSSVPLTPLVALNSSSGSRNNGAAAVFGVPSQWPFRLINTVYERSVSYFAQFARLVPLRRNGRKAFLTTLHKYASLPARRGCKMCTLPIWTSMTSVGPRTLPSRSALPAH